MTTRNKFLILLISLSIGLTACGGTTTGGDNDGGQDGGGNNGGGDGIPAAIQLGSFGAGNNFNSGVIAASVTSLMAGQSSTLTVNLVDQNQNPFTDAVDVNFSSPCVNSGISEIRIGDANAETITNSSGTVEVTYTARGCDGNDRVLATANVDGTTLTANVTLLTQQAPLSSIQFESATPMVIGIQGSGTLPEQSVLSFRVINSTGGPVANQQVSFDLNSTVGGITLSNMQDTTDGQGRVSTTVNSGTIPTTVRVTASTTQGNATRTTQSSGLSITTGIADADSFSLGLTCPNIEGDSINGNTADVTVLAADRFNNPVPDNTAIAFTTEGGSVGPSCQTVAGQCSVVFTTQEPRNSDHRYTLLATATGEESFSDGNGDGRFDDSETFLDLPEAFLDDNENGVQDSGEFFIDFNENGSYDGPSGDYNGLLCDGPSQCADKVTVNVRRSQVVVMSGSTAIIDVVPSTINLDGGAVSIAVTVGDSAGQQLAPGTTVAVTSDHGTINGPSSFTQPCSTDDSPATYVFTLAPEDDPGTGSFRITVTVPSDLQTLQNISVNQTVPGP